VRAQQETTAPIRVKYFVAMETKYTILVSTVTALVTLYPPLANQLQQPVTQLRSDNALTEEIERGSDI
jgi:hypothetical protein